MKHCSIESNCKLRCRFLSSNCRARCRPQHCLPGRGVILSLESLLPRESGWICWTGPWLGWGHPGRRLVTSLDESVVGLCPCPGHGSREYFVRTYIFGTYLHRCSLRSFHKRGWRLRGTFPQLLGGRLARAVGRRKCQLLQQRLFFSRRSEGQFLQKCHHVIVCLSFFVFLRSSFGSNPWNWLAYCFSWNDLASGSISVERIGSCRYYSHDHWCPMTIPNYHHCLSNFVI